LLLLLSQIPQPVVPPEALPLQVLLLLQHFQQLAVSTLLALFSHLQQ